MSTTTSGWAGQDVVIRVGSVHNQGTLTVPEHARGAVVFAHGSGSSRRSPRNTYVAGVLQQAGLATLLVDLLTLSEEDEERETQHLRFDVELLAERLLAAISWLGGREETRELPIGLFGASTGAAAALVAAAERPSVVRAVVSRGGRPDLAGRSLQRVVAPALFIVGGSDLPVLELNKQARSAMECVVRLEVIPGATHLFVEPGALERVAELARDWFEAYLLSESPAGET